MNILITILKFFDDIDRRIIYLLVAISLAIPLVLKVKLPPAQMATADAFYEAVEKLESSSDKIVLIAVDWGPNTQAENKAQLEVAIEHLMRKRVPFGLITVYTLATPFLENVPLEVAKRLNAEMPESTWDYGTDWVNFGFRPGSGIMIQSLAKAQDFHEHLKADALGTPIEDIPLMREVHTIKNISMLMEFTGLSGALQSWIQYFQAKEYRPPFLHGCTSISIPEAHIYFASEQLVGLFEGIAGAAWYELLLTKNFPNRKQGSALLINTGLAYAHLVIIGLIILGNIGLVASYLYKET